MMNDKTVADALKAFLERASARMQEPFISSFVVAFFVWGWPVWYELLWYPGKEETWKTVHRVSRYMGCVFWAEVWGSALFFTFAWPFVRKCLAEFSAKRAAAEQDSVEQIASSQKLLSAKRAVAEENEEKRLRTDEVLHTDADWRKAHKEKATKEHEDALLTRADWKKEPEFKVLESENVTARSNFEQLQRLVASHVKDVHNQSALVCLDRRGKVKEGSFVIVANETAGHIRLARALDPPPKQGEFRAYVVQRQNLEGNASLIVCAAHGAEVRAPIVDDDVGWLLADVDGTVHPKKKDPPEVPLRGIGAKRQVRLEMVGDGRARVLCDESNSQLLPRTEPEATS